MSALSHQDPADRTGIEIKNLLQVFSDEYSNSVLYLGGIKSFMEGFTSPVLQAKFLKANNDLEPGCPEL